MVSLKSGLPIVFLLLTTFYHLGEGRAPHKFLVGGSDDGWKVPKSSDKTLVQWAESQRFLVGDSIEFNYDANKDSVLEVTKENYEKCITEKALKKYSANQTILTFDVWGPYYFISGDHGNCVKGEKLIVVVQSPGHPPMPMPKPVPATAPPTPNHPPMPKPVPATAPPTPSNPPTSPPPTPPTPSKPPTSPAPAPANNTAVGLVAGSGIFWTSIAVIGLAWA